MPAAPRLVSPPANSRIQPLLPGAHFADAWAMPAANPNLSALGQFLVAARATPRWVDACMTLRNRVVRRLGLKDLGELAALSPARRAEDYRPGDRVGIFTLFENHPDGALLGDRDRHLDVTLSVHCAPAPAEGAETAGSAAQESARTGRRGGVIVTLTTVVHVHNLAGRLYMLPVAPMHRLIAPAVLKAVGRGAPPPVGG